MQFVCYDGWEQLPRSADALFASAAKESIFFSRPWFENLNHTGLEDDKKTLLACVVEGDEVRAVLPLCKRSGEHWQALTNLYSSLYTLLMAEDNRREILDCLARGLVQTRFSSLRLDPVAEHDRNIGDLQRAMESLGVTCQRRFAFYNWIHRTEWQSFNEYMSSRPGRVRNTVMRKARKLERDYDYSIRLYQEKDLQQALTDYDTVYKKSWKANELYGAFIEGLASTLAQAGWLRIAVLYVGKTPIAAQFWFVAHGRASIFKLVYDQEWKHYSPGSILTSYLMEHVIDNDKVSEIDFLTGNDAYKQDWMTERRERQILTCINQQVHEHKRHRLLSWLRRFM